MNPRQSRYYTYIKPIIRSRKVQEYGPIIFSLVMVSFFSIFALRPTLTTISSLQKAIETQNQTYQKIGEKIESIQTARNNYLAIPTQTRERIERLVPNDTALPSLIAEVTTLAQVYEASISGLQFETLDLDGKPTSLIKQPQKKEIPFALNITGEYLNILQFINALTKIDRIVTIDAINIRTSPEKGLTVTVNAKAHYFKH